MSDATQLAEDSAEMAYAAAAQAAAEHPLPADEPATAQKPKASRVRKTRAAEITKAPAEPSPAAEPKPASAKVARTRKVRRAKKSAPKPVRKPAKRAKGKTSANTKSPSVSQKDQIMAKTPDFTEGFKEVIAEVQEKTKVVFEKGTAAFAELNEQAKGNVEALVESSKILAAGLQDLGTNYVAESRSAFDTLTADVKELSSTRNPADLFKLQGELARRNFDNAVAFSSRSSEALLKLASEVFAPLSGRVNSVTDILKRAA